MSSADELAGVTIRTSGGDAASARLAAVLPGAAERLLNDEACFRILARHGVTITRDEARERLRLIRIAPANGDACCGVRARAVVGVPLIFACLRFAELHGRDARTTTQHELLHVLGLGESPSCADCQTAAEIQREVERVCR